MPKGELKKYRELLVKMRTQVGGDLSHITENTLNKSARDASGDLSGYSYHMADMASDDYERDFSLGRATDEQRRLYSIEEAMKRIEDGTYGSCTQCGKAIAKKRLSAMPQTERCIECQKQDEIK
jgi:RNA polymerase-binding protein DksA